MKKLLLCSFLIFILFAICMIYRTNYVLLADELLLIRNESMALIQTNKNLILSNGNLMQTNRNLIQSNKGLIQSNGTIPLLKPSHKEFSHGISIDKDYIYTNNVKFIVKGISYSPFYPGEKTGDEMKKADFSNDLSKISQANINTILLYSMRPVNIYKLCRDFNLKVIQGIWLDNTDDYQNPKYKKRMLVRIKYLIDFIHQNNLSDVILAYFIGGELDPLDIKTSNFKHKTMENYKSTNFINNRELNSAEKFLLEMADSLREYESSTYGKAHIVSHIDWPYGENVLNIDFMDIAMFDVYSYWPPEVSNYPNPGSYTSTAYQGYIENLKSRYKDTPVLISELGYSTAPEDNQVAVSEEEQANEIVNRWVDILTAKYPLTGAGIFEWNDEWWKHGKGVQNENPDENARIHDKDDYEQWFGIISIDGPSATDYKIRPKPAYTSVKNMYATNFNPYTYFEKSLTNKITNTGGDAITNKANDDLNKVK